jgi:hypothetical protein
LLIARGATMKVLVECRAATATPERVRGGGGGKPIEVARVQITEAGRRAL